MAEIPGRTATNRNSNAFEDVQSLWSIVSAYRHATPIRFHYIETHFCIDNCIIYKTVVSRSPIFTSKLFRVYNVQFITILRHFLKIFILFLNYWNSFSNFSNSKNFRIRILTIIIPRTCQILKNFKSKSIDSMLRLSNEIFSDKNTDS